MMANRSKISFGISSHDEAQAQLSCVLVLGEASVMVCFFHWIAVEGFVTNLGALEDILVRVVSSISPQVRFGSTDGLFWAR